MKNLITLCVHVISTMLPQNGGRVGFTIAGSNRHDRFARSKLPLIKLCFRFTQTCPFHRPEQSANSHTCAGVTQTRSQNAPRQDRPDTRNHQRRRCPKQTAHHAASDCTGHHAMLIFRSDRVGDGPAARYVRAAQQKCHTVMRKPRLLQFIHGSFRFHSIIKNPYQYRSCCSLHGNSFRTPSTTAQASRTPCKVSAVTGKVLIWVLFGLGIIQFFWRQPSRTRGNGGE